MLYPDSFIEWMIYIYKQPLQSPLKSIKNMQISSKIDMNDAPITSPAIPPIRAEK